MRRDAKKHRCWDFHVGGISNFDPAYICSKEKALQQKYRTIKKVEYLCAESKMDEGVNESITIRVTFKGPTPSNGPMDTIQKLFSAKSITPNSVVLRRGRPRRHLGINIRQGPTEMSANDFDYPEKLMIAPRLKDSTSSSCAMILPSLKDSTSSSSVSTFEYLPSLGIQPHKLSLRSGESTVSMADGTKLNENPCEISGAKYCHSDRLGDVVAALPVSQTEFAEISRYSQVSSDCSTTNNPYDALGSTDHSIVSLATAQSTPKNSSSSRKRIRQLSQGDSSLSVSTSCSSDSCNNAGQLRRGGSAGISSSSSPPNGEYDMLTCAYGSARCIVECGTPGWFPDLCVYISTDCNPFVGQKVCMLTFTGNEESIKEVMYAAVSAEFYVGNENPPLVVKGEVIYPHRTYPDLAMSDMLIPDFKGVFPDDDARSGVDCVTANVTIWVHIPNGRVIRTEPCFIYVSYVRPNPYIRVPFHVPAIVEA